MKKYLVIGNPIEHSLSPKLQNYWIKNNKLDAVYGKLETYEKDLIELCANLREGKLDGLNVTIPFKNKIIPHLDLLSGNALSFNFSQSLTEYTKQNAGVESDIDMMNRCSAVFNWYASYLIKSNDQSGSCA